MVKRFKKVLFFLLLTAGVVACTKEATQEVLKERETIQRMEKSPPYATQEELTKFSGHAHVVDYKISREMALADLDDFRGEFFYNETPLFLSEMPVLVYDASGEPKYYEFIVSNGKDNVGTITCFAQKEVPGFTAYVLPFVRNYNEKNAQRYSNAYPNVGSDEEINLRASASRIPTEEELEIAREAKAFWEFLENPEPFNPREAGLVRARSVTYNIPEFNNDALQRTFWKVACGPASLAWLYRAYNTHYKGTYYPLHGETSSGNLDLISDYNVSFYREKNSLYKDLAEKCRVGYGPDPLKGAAFPDKMKRAVREIFPNHKLEGGTPLTMGKARINIEKNNPTILMLRSGVQLHYVVGFGTKNRYNTYNLGLFKVRKVHTDSWIRITDNGTMTKKHKYLPYYMNTHAIVGKDFVTFVLKRK